VKYGLLLSAAFLLLLPSTSSATVIYDNGLPITDPSTSCSPFCAELTTSTGHGLFSLVADSTITSIRFWTFQSPGSYKGGTLSWHIYLDNAGVEGTLIGSSTFKLSQTSIGPVDVAGLDLDGFQNDIPVASLAISPPSSPQGYFLDITDVGGGDILGIFWATSGENTFAFQLSGSGNGVPPDTAATPEPSTMALLAAGAVTCLAARRWTLR
jgi:hypothetical protein